MPPETRRDGSDSSANRGSHIRIIAGLSEAQRVKKKKYHQRNILSDRVVVISEEFRCPICGKGQREVFQAKLMKVRQRSLVYENYDIAIAMSSSRADPVLGHCPG